MLSEALGDGTRSEMGCLPLAASGSIHRSLTWARWPGHPGTPGKEVAQSRKIWSWEASSIGVCRPASESPRHPAYLCPLFAKMALPDSG